MAQDSTEIGICSVVIRGRPARRKEGAKGQTNLGGPEAQAHGTLGTRWNPSFMVRQFIPLDSGGPCLAPNYPAGGWLVTSRRARRSEVDRGSAVMIGWGPLGLLHHSSPRSLYFGGGGKF